MKRLIREVAPAAFEKCFEDRSVQNWTDGVQADIFRSAMYMTELTALKLHVRCPPLHGLQRGAAQSYMLARCGIPNVCFVLQYRVRERERLAINEGCSAICLWGRTAG